MIDTINPDAIDLSGLVTDVWKSNFGRLTSATPGTLQISACASF